MYQWTKSITIRVVIELKNVSKKFKENDYEIEVFKNLNFSFNTNQTYVLLGASGSGKSTLLNLISTIDDIDSGEILFDQQDISKLNSNQKAIFRRVNVGFIFQFFNLIPTLNVLDNILLPLKLSKKLTTVSKNFAVELLEEVGLGARVNAMPEKLSGGQQQRVAIVRALVTNPKIVVADEPTGNLDLETADIILDLIFNLAKKHHKTVIIATHDLAIGKRSDQVLLVKNKGIFLN